MLDNGILRATLPVGTPTDERGSRESTVALHVLGNAAGVAVCDAVGVWRVEGWAMSKGKNQASQNAKKLLEAQQHVSELRQELASVIASAQAEKQELVAERQAIRNRLASEVDALAKDKVSEARRQAQRQIDQFKRQHEEAAISAMSYLTENGDVRLSLEGWGQVASILKVHPGKLVASVSKHGNRKTRRASASRVREIADIQAKN